ncbi:MAG: hypothetical protein FWG84_06235, partial [Bacteroidales bacterium]|nr:hypothetical protein [Bacteroidales bacterium]
MKKFYDFAAMQHGEMALTSSALSAESANFCKNTNGRNHANHGGNVIAGITRNPMRVMMALFVALMIAFGAGSAWAQSCTNITMAVTGIKPVQCLNDGNITVTLSGVNLPNITIDTSQLRVITNPGGLVVIDWTSWSSGNPKTSPDLPSGSYTVEFRAFCKGSGTFDPNNPVWNVSGISTTATVGTDYKTFGFGSTGQTQPTYAGCGKNGSANIAFSGIPPFELKYAIAPAGSGLQGTTVTYDAAGSYTLNNLPVGYYQLDGTDYCGSGTSATFTLTTTGTPFDFPQPTTIVAASCNNGSITVVPAGGLSPYKVEIISAPAGYIIPAPWNITGSHAINNLYPGNYGITITDACGTPITNTPINVPNASAFVFNVATIANNPSLPTCGSNNGMVTLHYEPLGHTFSLKLVAPIPTGYVGAQSWPTVTPNATTGNAAISGLVAGTYYFEADDKCGNTLPLTVVVPASPLTLDFTYTTVPALTCPTHTGGISISMTSMTQPATITLTPISGGYSGQTVFTSTSTSYTIPNLPAGTYTVNITDACPTSNVTKTVTVGTLSGDMVGNPTFSASTTSTCGYGLSITRTNTGNWTHYYTYGYYEHAVYRNGVCIRDYDGTASATFSCQLDIPYYQFCCDGDVLQIRLRPLSCPGSEKTFTVNTTALCTITPFTMTTSPNTTNCTISFTGNKGNSANVPKICAATGTVYYEEAGNPGVWVNSGISGSSACGVTSFTISNVPFVAGRTYHVRLTENGADPTTCRSWTQSYTATAPPVSYSLSQPTVTIGDPIIVEAMGGEPWENQCLAGEGGNIYMTVTPTGADNFVNAVITYVSGPDNFVLPIGVPGTPEATYTILEPPTVSTTAFSLSNPTTGENTVHPLIEGTYVFTVQKPCSNDIQTLTCTVAQGCPVATNTGVAAMYTWGSPLFQVPCNYEFNTAITCNGMEIRPNPGNLGINVSIHNASMSLVQINCNYQIICEEHNIDVCIPRVQAYTVTSGTQATRLIQVRNWLLNQNNIPVIYNAVLPGTYKIRMRIMDCEMNCYITETEVVYPENVTIDPDNIYAYKCVDQSEGYIIINGINGVPPYKYWLRHPVTKAIIKELQYDDPTYDACLFLGVDSNSGDNGIFEVYIEDSCDPPSYNATNVEMKKLESLNIAYTKNGGVYCAGEEVELNALSLSPDALYSWSGPDYNSPGGLNDQYPRFPGVYSDGLPHDETLYVTIPACANPKIEPLAITILDEGDPPPPTIITDDVEVCFHTGDVNIVTLSGITTASGCELRWYADDNPLSPPITPPTSFPTTTPGNYTLWVSQIAVSSICLTGESIRMPVTVEVSNTGDCDACPISDWQRLKAAVENSGGPTTITIYSQTSATTHSITENLTVANATMVLCGYDDYIDKDDATISVNRNVTIKSSAYDNIAIYAPLAAYSGNAGQRHFTLTGGSGDLTLEKLILDGSLEGSAKVALNDTTPHAGGILLNASGAALTVGDGAVIQYCSALNGGGIYGGEGTTIDIHNSSIIGNTANGDGTNWTGNGGGIHTSGIVSISGNSTKISGNKAIGIGGKEIVTGHGGGIYCDNRVSGVELTMTGGTIGGNAAGEGNIATGIGGGISDGPGSFTPIIDIKDSEIIGNASIHGGGIGAIYGATVTAENTIFSYNSVVSDTIGGFGGGGGICGGTITLKNCEVTHNVAGGAGGINVEDLTLIGDITVTHNEAIIAGGIYGTNFYLDDLDKLTVTHNRATGYHFGSDPWHAGTIVATGGGGGILVDGSLSFPPTATIIITDNLAGESGGGILGRGPATSLTLSGNINISNNKAGYNFTTLECDQFYGYGGGVFSHGPLFLADSVFIFNNEAGGYGGGICATYSDILSQADTVSIYNNVSGPGGGIASKNDLTLKNNVNITGNKSSSMGGGIYCEGSLTLDGNINVSYNEADYTGGGINLYTFSGKSFTIEDDTKLTVSHNKAIRNSDPNAGGGGIRIWPSDLPLTIPVSAQVDITHNLTGGNGGGIYTPAPLTIQSSKVNISYNKSGYDFDLDTCSYATNGNGGGIRAFTLALSNTSVGYNEAGGGGGGVYASSGLTLDNVNISHNIANGGGGGGGVCTPSGAVLTLLNDITVSHNTARGSYGGGGIAISFGVSSVTATALGKLTVNNNRAISTSSYGGGGIYNGSVALTFPATSEIEISNNLSGSSGGGIYNQTNAASPLIFNGPVTILNNKAGYDFAADTCSNTGGHGGGIYASTPYITLSESTNISGNATGGSGGGIYYNTSSAGALSFSGTTTISGNTAGVNGGGIGAVSFSPVNFLGSTTISGNAAFGDGGGIHAAGTTFFNDELTLSNNIAGGAGGGIYTGRYLSYNTNTASVTTTGPVTISNNKAGYDFTTGECSITDGHGGGISSSGTLLLKDATITDNIAGGNGGGIYGLAISYYSQYFKISGQTNISGNTAVSGSGGGVYSTELTLEDTITISNNIAEGSGGGICAVAGYMSFGPNTTNVKKLTVTDNISNDILYGGGGIYAGARLDLSNAEYVNFSGNHAEKDGGAIYFQRADNWSGAKYINIRNNSRIPADAIFSDNTSSKWWDIADRDIKAHEDVFYNRTGNFSDDHLGVSSEYAFNNYDINYSIDTFFIWNWADLAYLNRLATNQSSVFADPSEKMLCDYSAFLLMQDLVVPGDEVAHNAEGKAGGSDRTTLCTYMPEERRMSGYGYQNYMESVDVSFSAGHTNIYDGDQLLVGQDETPLPYPGWDEYGWIPIGNSYSFTGSVFDGQGFSVNGLWIDRDTDYYSGRLQGLFGWVSDSYIQNLGVNIIDSVKGYGNLGGLAAQIDDSDIVNCYVTGKVIGRDNVGGLAGNAWESNITNCYSTGMVSGTEYIGGLVGSVGNSDISGCYVTGTVEGSNTVGGLVGWIEGSTLSNSYATGAVSGENGVGGLAGYGTWESTITNCYATGAVEGTEGVAGLVGAAEEILKIEHCFAFNPQITAPTANYFGRILGVDVDGTVDLAYNYALDSMKINNDPITDVSDIAPDGVHGDNVKACDATDKIKNIFKDTNYGDWGAEFDDYWTFDYDNYNVVTTTGSETNLPILKTFDKNSNYGFFANALQPPRVDGCVNTFQIWNWADLAYLNILIDNQKTFNNDPSFTGDKIENYAGFVLMQDLGIPDSIGTYGLGEECLYDGNRKFGWYGYHNWATASGYDGSVIDNSALIVGGSGTTGIHTIPANATDLPWVDGEGWVPIGTSFGLPYFDNNPFYGIFDGQGHEITGLWIDRGTEQYQGLFGYVVGPLDNVAGPSDIPARIENLGVNIIGAVKGDQHVGGLVGLGVGQLEVSNCYVTGAVQGAGGLHIGGLGGAFNNAGNNPPHMLLKITNCYTTCDVTGRRIGGIVGESAGYVEITGCYSTGTITGDDDMIGGIAGGFYRGAKMNNCYATGKIAPSALSTWDNVGGIVGHLVNATIRNCYATCVLEGNDEVGGIVGAIWDNYDANYSPSSISNCFAFNPQITATAAATAGRVLGAIVNSSNGPVTLANNQALDSMKITIDGVPTIVVGAENDEHGKDISACAALQDTSYEYTNPADNWDFADV